MITAVVTLTVVVVMVNALVFRHAYCMLHLRRSGKSTGPPEEMSFLHKLRTAFLGVTLVRPGNEKTPPDIGLDYSVETFEAADKTQLEAWRIDHPEPRGVVMLFHGYVTRKDILLEEARDFHQVGFSCLLVDFRGSGGSGGNTTSIGYFEAHDVAAAYYHAVKMNVAGPIVMYGQSMGGAAILRAVDALKVKPDGIILESVFDRLKSAVRQRFQTVGLPAVGLSELTLVWGSAQLKFNAFRHNPIDYALGVQCPALVINGNADKRVTLDQARALLESISDRRKELVVIDGGTHMSPRAANPQQWRSAVESFLDQITGNQ